MTSYGICPKCGAVDPPGTSRNVRMRGVNTCGACGKHAYSFAWTISSRDSEIAELRSKLKDVDRVQKEIDNLQALVYEWGNDRMQLKGLVGPSTGGSELSLVEELTASIKHLTTSRNKSTPGEVIIDSLREKVAEREDAGLGTSTDDNATLEPPAVANIDGEMVDVWGPEEDRTVHLKVFLGRSTKEHVWYALHPGMVPTALMLLNYLSSLPPNQAPRWLDSEGNLCG